MAGANRRPDPRGWRSDNSPAARHATDRWSGEFIPLARVKSTYHPSWDFDGRRDEMRWPLTWPERVMDMTSPNPKAWRKGPKLLKGDTGFMLNKSNNPRA